MNESATGLTWEDVANASSYAVKVNDGEYQTATEYLFATEAATYTVSIKAIGNGSTYLDSLPATWTYTTKAVSLSDITVNNLNATWESVGFVSTAFSKTGDIAESDWADHIGANGYTATENGKLGVVVDGGYDGEKNIYYVGDSITKYAWMVEVATENETLLNKDTEVEDDIVSYAYGNNGWEDAGAHAALTVGKADIEESDEVIGFKVQQLSNAYKFAYEVSDLNAYAGISCKVKGDDKSTFVLQLTGSIGYASLNLGVLSSNWNSIYVPFDYNGWLVNGTAMTLSEFALAGDFQNPGQTLFAFNEVDVVIKTVNDASYSYTNLYLDNLTLVAASTSAYSLEESYNIAGTYTGSNASGLVFSMASTGSDTVKLASLNAETNIGVDQLKYSKDGTTVTIKTLDDGASLTYVGKATDKGRSLSYISSSGTYGTYLAGVDFNYVFTVDDFES